MTIWLFIFITICKSIFEKEKLLNEKMTFLEKLMNSLVEILVRKKIKKQLLKIVYDLEENVESNKKTNHGGYQKDLNKLISGFSN